MNAGEGEPPMLLNVCWGDLLCGPRPSRDPDPDPLLRGGYSPMSSFWTLHFCRGLEAGAKRVEDHFSPKKTTHDRCGEFNGFYETK